MHSSHKYTLEITFLDIMRLIYKEHSAATQKLQPNLYFLELSKHFGESRFILA